MRIFNSGRRRTGSSSDRYTRNGSMTIDTIPEVPSEESPPHRNGTAASSGRPAFQWPFQNQSISESSAQHTRSTSFPTRRGSGWINLRPASSVLGSDIIPDYVVNYIRGETPETLARRRERDGNPHTPDVHHNRNQSSQFAELFSTYSRLSRGMDLEDMLGARKKGGTVGKFMTGWRGGVALNMSLALVILLAAIVCVIVAVIKRKISGEPATIVAGSCSRVSAIDLGVHAVVNVLAIFFLVGANYVAQVLASPTRTEVSAAHGKQRWLDIGIPSIRNLGGISTARKLLSVLVVVIAISTQVIYNSIVFTAEATSTGDSTCSLFLNGPLLGAVAILNLLFILTLAAALARPSSANPLVTIGDAISSFLMEPDHSTEGACLVTKAEISSGRWACGEARLWAPQSHRWMQTPSKIRWLVWFVTWLLPAGMAAAILGMAAVDGPKDAFTSFSEATSTYPLPPSIPRLGHSIIMALPHLLLAVLYFSTNALMSVFYLSHEFSQFAVPGVVSNLRISSGQPMGAQITSLYLTLPRPLSWLLFILFIAMSFMLSQSFNLVAVDDTPSVGVSPLPTAILLGVLVITAALVAGLSLRRADVPPATEDDERTGNPLALKGGSCSAVISARCHRSAQEGPYMTSLPLSWGAVFDAGAAGKVGHATFSGRSVDALKTASPYI